MNQPLSLQFGSEAVSIQVEETAVWQKLAFFLQKANRGTAPLPANYTLKQGAVGWQLWRAQTQLGRADQPEALFEIFLQDALEQLISPQEAYLIFHAGGLVWQGQGLLVCGPTGSGKSTLVAQLVAAGGAYLTDEAVAVPLKNFEMRGFARPIVLKTGSEFVWQNAEKSEFIYRLPGGFTWLLPPFFRAGSWGEAAVPKVVVFPRYQAGAALAVQQLTPAAAAFQLMQQLVNARNLPNKGVTAVSRLAPQVAAYEVVYGQGTAVVEWLLSAVVNV